MTQRQSRQGQPSSLSQRGLAPDRPSVSPYSTYADPYPGRHVRTQSTSSAGSSGGVVPLPVKTYVRMDNGALVSANRDGGSYSNYNATSPRRTSYVPSDVAGPRRASTMPQNASSSGRHNSTTVIHNEPSSALVRRDQPAETRERDPHVMLSNSDRSRPQVKAYRFDKNDRSHLVDTSPRDDRNRNYYDGQPARSSATARRDRGYHLTGAQAGGNENDYEFIKPQEMYTDTRPLWRPRRSSVDGRPTSMYESRQPGSNAPPPARKGLDRISEGLTRTTSLREDGVSPSRYRTRGRGGSYSEDDNYDGRGPVPTTRQHPVYNGPPDQRSPLRSDFDERREPRPLRRMSKFEDSDLRNRGFGIRAGSAGSRDRRESSTEPGASYKLPLFGPPLRREGDEPRRDGGGRDAELRDYEWPAARDDAYHRRRHNEGEVTTRTNEGRRERRRDEYEDDRRRGNDTRHESEPFQKPNGDDAHRKHRTEALAAAASAGAAAYAVDHSRRQRSSPPTDKEPGADYEVRESTRKGSPDEDKPRKRQYVPKEVEADKDPEAPADSADADEEYRRRIQQEIEGTKQPKSGTAQPTSRVEDQRDDTSDSEPPSPRSPPTHHRHEAAKDAKADAEPSADTSQALTRYEPPQNDDDDEELAEATGALALVKSNEQNRVRIVEPPKDKAVPRGILRKPTEKFPEDPNPVREGVAQHRNMLKDGVPINATWTKITREKVSPAALEEAGERFEVRQGSVIVLRALSKDEIQKFADRTRQIRDSRHRDSHDHGHHDQGRSRRHRDDDDEDD